MTTAREGMLRYGYEPRPEPLPFDWHVNPSSPWWPAEAHAPDRCHPRCPRWPGYLGVPL